MADFDRSYHHNYSNSYSYNPRLSTDQNQNPPFSLNPSRPSTDQTSSYSYSYSYNTSRPSTDQAPPYDANNSYEYNGRLDIVPRQQPLPPAVVAPRPVAVVGSSSGPWCFGDPEMKRKRRVASYKAYSVEGKVKSSIRKGFRWIKGDSRWCGSQDGWMVGSSLGPMSSIRSALRSVRTNLEADRTVVEPMRPSLSPIGIGPKLVLDG